MDKGILDIELLEKDIEQIKYYSNEENKKLNKICSKFKECCNYYSSKNSSMLINDIGILNNNINKIHEKRTKYISVLSSVIIQYNELARETKRIFD